MSLERSRELFFPHAVAETKDLRARILKDGGNFAGEHT